MTITTTTITAVGTAPRRVTCRYLRRTGEQCTGEALDPLADVLICAKHAARVMEMIRMRLPR